MRHTKRPLPATAICCLGVVGIGLLFENSIFSLAIATGFCIGALSHAASEYDSRSKAARLFVLNAVLLTLIFVPLRLALSRGWLPMDYFNSSWPYRIYRVWSLSESSAIILAIVAAGLITIHVAGMIGGDLVQNRFQWGTLVSASVLVAINIAHFLRPVSCADCFFPYGLPFTLFTEGGYGGGGGFVWSGLVADAALIPVLATISTLLWNHFPKPQLTDRSRFH